MKNKIIFLSTLIFFFINPVKAENWFPIEAQNGKITEIDLDSIQKNDDFIRYNLKQNKQDNVVISCLETNYIKKETAILNQSIYDNEIVSKIGFEDFSKDKKYYPVKQGTLNEAVYNFLSLSIDSPVLKIDSIIWDKYFKKQQKKMQKHWHPNIMQCKHYPKERAIAYMLLMVDRDGNVLQKKYTNSTNKASKYNDFNERLKKEIYNIFEKVPKFNPLPKEYLGEKIFIIIKFEYSYKNDAQMKPIVFNDLGFGYLEMGKNYSALSAIGQLLLLPLKIPYCIFVEPFIK